RHGTCRQRGRGQLAGVGGSNRGGATGAAYRDIMAFEQRLVRVIGRAPTETAGCSQRCRRTLADPDAAGYPCAMAIINWNGSDLPDARSPLGATSSKPWMKRP